MSETSLWLVLVGFLLVAELTTGTIYLLLIALGAGLSAAAAWFGFSLTYQIIAGACFAVLACLGLQRIRARQLKNTPQCDNLDLGNSVQVTFWKEGGFTQVDYRGTTWSAQSVDKSPVSGLHVIVAVDGNLLKIKSRNSN